MHDNKPGIPLSGSQAVPLLAEITATIATASSPCLGGEEPFAWAGSHPTPAVAMARRPSCLIDILFWYIRMTQARTATIPKPNPGCSQAMPHCFQRLDGLWRRVESWTREFVDPCRHAMSTPHLCRNRAILTATREGMQGKKTAREPCSRSPKSPCCCPARAGEPSFPRTASAQGGILTQWLATNQSHCGSPGLVHSGNTVDLPPPPPLDRAPKQVPVGDLGHAGRNSCGLVALWPCGPARQCMYVAHRAASSLVHTMGFVPWSSPQARSELQDLVRRMQLGQHGLKIRPDAQRNHSKISGTLRCFFLTGAFRPSSQPAPPRFFR